MQGPITPEQLTEALDERMRQDVARMKRWRLFHRGLGIAGSLVLIVCPLLVASGLLRAEGSTGQILLSAVSVAGALVTTFKPFLHSRKRRNDMNTMRALHDQFRAELAAAQGERAQLRTFAKYSTIFASVYRARGDTLVDAELDRDVVRNEATVEGDGHGLEDVTSGVTATGDPHAGALP
jgi:hypothetical protein